jgi:DNA polymerase I-like protein with 3'-5' exonuclease and polymerase domains
MLYKEIWQNYPVVSNFLYHVAKNGLRTLIIRNVCGKVRNFNPIKAGCADRSKQEYHIQSAAKNPVIQSLSADITKIEMGNLFLILRPMGVRFCNTIHDEIVVEAPEEIAGEVARIIGEVMVKAGKIFLTDVPCEAETSRPVDRWVK